MERRFTMKDVFFAALLAVLIGVVILAMFQYDRQWQTLKQLERRVAEQAASQADQSKQVEAIRKTLASGVSFNASAGATTQPSEQSLVSAKGDPFEALRAAEAQPDYARGDWLIQNFGVKVSKLTPLLSTDTYASMVQNRIIDSYGYRDPDTLEWKPQLATDWTVSPDGLTINLKLRHGVQFSDGAPFTADDVVFALEFLRNPDVDAPRQRAAYEPVDRIEKVNDYEVNFVFKRPYFEALTLTLGSSPMHKKFYSHYTPRQFNETVGLLIGTGPYRMPDPESWRPGTPIQLVRNERYWGPAAPFNRIYWREVEEDAAALTMFRNGEVDTFSAQPEQYDSLKNDPDIRKKSTAYQFYFRDGGYSYVAWNESRKQTATLFADKRVRQAMTLLIDRERIAKDVFRGYAKPAVGPFGVVSPQNDPEIAPWPYDVKRAQALLAEVGFKSKNAQGILVNDAGREFRFKFTYGNKDPNTERVVLQIKDSLARVGIVLEQEPADWPIIIKKLDERDFDAITLGWTGGVETDIYQMFHSSQIKEGDNCMSYSNPELDKAIEQARATINVDERMKYWRQAHKILNEDQPYTFMMLRQSLTFVDNRIANVKQTKSGLNYFAQDTMPMPWYVPTAQQRHND